MMSLPACLPAWMSYEIEDLVDTHLSLQALHASHIIIIIIAVITLLPFIAAYNYRVYQ